MREILFRGKRLDNGERVEGIPIFYRAGRCVIVVAFAPLTKAVECYAVDPFTVGQYTGLTAKNGKRIFEGDVLFDPHPCVQERYEVIWFGGDFMRKTINRHYLTLSPLNCRDFEIIGNIHDNPELMERGRES